MERAERILGHIVPSPKVTDSRPFIIVMLGAPGSGKGTYAKILSKEFGIPAISTGDLVRAEIKAGTKLGMAIKDVASAGGFVSDEIILELLARRLAKEDAAHGYILDGFPRTLAQAEALSKVAPISVVLDIDMPEAAILQTTTGRRVCSKCGEGYNVGNVKIGDLVLPPLRPRVDGICDKCGSALVHRADDREDVVRARLALYHEQAPPVQQFYAKQGMLVTHKVKRGKLDGPEVIELLKTRKAMKTTK